MNMKIRKMKGNNKGQVLGLPMYLIIIMIVAVAVIAAVIFMLPQGTKTIKAQVTEGSVYSTGTLATDGTYNFNAFQVTVLVTTSDERSDPIYGATVRLSGGGVIAQGTTDNSGTVVFDGGTGAGHGNTITGAKLDPNNFEANMKLTIKASGYEDYTDDSAVLLYRPT